jgi:hypothetical protein
MTPEAQIARLQREVEYYKRLAFPPKDEVEQKYWVVSWVKSDGTPAGIAFGVQSDAIEFSRSLPDNTLHKSINEHVWYQTKPQ